MAEIKTAGARLRKMRLDAGLTQESLAQLIGRSARSVSNWESDRHRVPGSVAPLLARTLRVDIDKVTR
jgi:transcriptional regulator with XRE-family HTH domain